MANTKRIFRAFMLNLNRRTTLHWRNFHTSYPKNSRFVQFSSKEHIQSLGILSKDLSEIIDLSNVDPTIPNTLVQYLEREPILSQKIPK